MGEKVKTRIYCIVCEQMTHHEIVAQISDRFTPKSHPDMQIDWAEGTWEILKCCGCDQVTFRETWMTSEDIVFEPKGDGFYTEESEPTIRLFPPRDKNMLPIKPYYNVPPILRRIYRETIECYNNEIYTLCAAGLRALIEGICVDNKVKDGPVERLVKGGVKKPDRSSKLEGKIAGMAERGLLAKKHAEALHEHRFMGNSAVHELRMPSAEDLKLAIEIIEYTLDNLYELPDKSEQIRLRRERSRRRGPNETLAG